MSYEKIKQKAPNLFQDGSLVIYILFEIEYYMMKDVRRFQEKTHNS